MSCFYKSRNPILGSETAENRQSWGKRDYRRYGEEILMMKEMGMNHTWRGGRKRTHAEIREGKEVSVDTKQKRTEASDEKILDFANAELNLLKTATSCHPKSNFKSPISGCITIRL